MALTHKIGVLLLGVVTAAAVPVTVARADTTSEAEAAATRDPWLWPFAATSVWNTPIGSGANYVAAGHFTPETWVSADLEIHRKLKASDPLRPVYGVPNWTSRCTDRTKPQNVSINVPDDFIQDSVVTTGGRYETPNDVAALLQPDGKLIQIEPLARCTRAGDVFGYVNPKGSEKLDANGLYGAHWGSGLSSIGGSLRHGELTGDIPIRHVLKLNVPGNKLHYDASNPENQTDGVVLRGKGYRWPADRNDGGAPGDYQGSVPAVTMGALTALPPSVTAESLGLKTEPAKRMFAALRDYGAYIVDNSGQETRDGSGNLTWGQYSFSVGEEAVAEFEERQGYSINQNNQAAGSAKDWFDDVTKLVGKLAVIDNNAPTTIGGPGTRRVTAAIPPLGTSDAQAPSTPSGFTAGTVTHTSVALSWQAATDNVRIMSYEVVENGLVVARTGGKTSVVIDDLQAESSHTYAVRAVDTNGNTSAATAPLTVTTAAGYSETFNNGTAAGWTLPDGVTLADAQLRLSGWDKDKLAAVHERSWSGPYTVAMSVRTDVQNDGGKTRVLFNYNGANHTYFAEFGGGQQNTVRIGKRINGTDTTISTYAGNYTVWQGNPARIAIRYGNDKITVTATRDGTATKLFDAVPDYSLSSGRIGVEVSGTQSFADDVTVQAG